MKYKKLLFYLYIYKILKTTQQFYFNKSKILGQDRFMVASKQNEYKNYPMVVYYLKENHNNLYNFLYNKLKEKINYKKSPIRLKQINKNRFGYSDEPIEKILDYSLVKIDSIKKINKMEICKYTLNNSN